MTVAQDAAAAALRDALAGTDMHPTSVQAALDDLRARTDVSADAVAALARASHAPTLLRDGIAYELVVDRVAASGITRDAAAWAVGVWAGLAGTPTTTTPSPDPSGEPVDANGLAPSAGTASAASWIRSAPPTVRAAGAVVLVVIVVILAAILFIDDDDDEDVVNDTTSDTDTDNTDGTTSDTTGTTVGPEPVPAPEDPAEHLQELIDGTQAALDRFWAEQLPRHFGVDYVGVTGWFPYNSGDAPGPGNACPPDALLPDNAVWCPPTTLRTTDPGSIAYDLDFVTLLESSTGVQEFDRTNDMLPIWTFAHEMGHAVDHMVGGRTAQTLAGEQKADCYAGYFLAHINEPGHRWGGVNLEPGDVEEAIHIVSTWAEGTLPNDPNLTHGTSEQRAQALQFGFLAAAISPTLCDAYDNATREARITFAEGDNLLLVSGSSHQPIAGSTSGGFRVTHPAPELTDVTLDVGQYTNVTGTAVDTITTVAQRHFGGSEYQLASEPAPFGPDGATVTYVQDFNGTNVIGVLYFVVTDGRGLLVDAYVPLHSDDTVTQERAARALAYGAATVIGWSALSI